MSSSIKIKPRAVSRTAAPAKPISTASQSDTEENDNDGTVQPMGENRDSRDEARDTPVDERQPRGDQTSLAEPPKDMTRLLYNSMERQRFQTRPKVWPPEEGPNDDRCYVVEGTGADNQSKNADEDDALDGLPKGEVVEDHVGPVSELKERFVDRPRERTPGVNKPIAQVKGPVSWIKHVKLPPQYDNDPKELPWMQLVRNRRWKSTIKARFPCRKDDVTNFERRSTTPKNWHNLLRDKHSTKLLSEIAGLEGAGEELLYRLAEQRQKEDTSHDDVQNRPMTEEEILAYQYVRDHLEDGLISAEEEHGRRTGSESSSKTNAEYALNRLLKTPVRLHPEQFKKLLSLERSREATLRWQFSSDPYDSVHEHQQIPFELALATGDNERLIHQALKKLLQSYEYDVSEVFDMPPPVSTLTRSASVSSSRGSRRPSQQSDEHQPRSRSANPETKQRRSRSVSPSVRCMTDTKSDDELDEMIRKQSAPLLNAKEEEILKEELSKLQKEIGMKELIDDLKNEDENNNSKTNKSSLQVPSSNGCDASSEDEEHNLPLEDRMKKFFAADKKSKESTKRTNTDQDDIDVTEVASKRAQFLNQERQSSLEKAEPIREKPRKIINRCRSDAELHEWLSRRREQTDAAVEDQEEQKKEGGNDMMAEMTNLINDMQETFSGSGHK